MKQELHIKKEELPEGWKIALLLDVVDVEKGTEPGSSSYSNTNGTPFLRIGEVSGKSKSVIFTTSEKIKLVNEKDILMTFDGSPGLVCRGLKGAISSGIRKISSNEERVLLNDYLFWILQARIVQKTIGKYTKGAILKHAGSSINHIKIILPPLPIQQKIASNLDKQMAQIEMMKKEAEKEFENTRELLDSYLKDFFQNKLDETWHTSKLSDVCIINPRKPELVYSDNQPTSFVPMESVDAEGGVVNNPKIQPFVKVKKGYTYFEENDVLFAKITPCMQNKKSAVAKDLINKFGFGTTEWHVFRCKENILPEWVLYFIRQQSFIEQAKSRFTGAVGQQRVPKDFIENYEISYPDIEIQKLLIYKLKNIITEQETIMKDMTNQLNAISQLPSSILNQVFGQYKIPEEV